MANLVAQVRGAACSFAGTPFFRPRISRVAPERLDAYHSHPCTIKTACTNKCTLLQAGSQDVCETHRERLAVTTQISPLTSGPPSHRPGAKQGKSLWTATSTTPVDPV